MKYKELHTYTKNISKSIIYPKAIILHHTGGSFMSGINTVLNPASQKSYHCIVNQDGNRAILAKDNSRCWHAGKSVFNGVPNCNNYSLGIALTGNTYERPLTLEEVDSVCEWIYTKMCYYNIKLNDITTHRHVSQNRKIDISKQAFNTIIEHLLRNWYGKL